MGISIKWFNLENFRVKIIPGVMAVPKKFDKSKTCPHCNYIFEKTPPKKTKCPECKKDIYLIKTNDGDWLVKEGQYVEDKIIKSLEHLGFTRDQFYDYKSGFYEKSGKATQDDFYWSLYNYLLNEKGKKDDYYAMKQIYLLMTDHVKDNPDLYHSILKSIKRTDLYEIKYNSGFKKVQITSNPGSCSSCKAIENKILTVEQALKEEPLPNPQCTSERGCSCFYTEYQ